VTTSYRFADGSPSRVGGGEQEQDAGHRKLRPGGGTDEKRREVTCFLVTWEDYLAIYALGSMLAFNNSRDS
jgi:hypothetical protein